VELERIDWSKFIECDSGVLIAPAGHGKTTAIADCLLQCPADSCYLVLTHTHAGIASLKSKFRAKNVPAERYVLDTITSFAQRIVLSINGKSLLPDEEDSTYFDSAVCACAELVQKPIMKHVIGLSYSGLFVDEYQDCTINQHNFIMALGECVPLHILGDHMQGIFTFEKIRLVDFEADLFFMPKFYELKYPWRWHPDNIKLGQYIFDTRTKLEQRQNILLQTIPEANVFVELYPKVGKYGKEYNSWIRSIMRRYDSESLLVICPSYKERNQYNKLILRGQIKDRIMLKSIFDFSNQFQVLDAIDSSKYYMVAKAIDKLVSSSQKSDKSHKITQLYNILDSMYVNSSFIDAWINKKKDTFISRKKEYAVDSSKLIQLFNDFMNYPTVTSLMKVIEFFFSLKQLKCHHKSVYFEVKHAAKIAQEESTKMYEAMKMLKAKLRHTGRKIEGRCIGSTLLTKGLEFDTVIICDVDKFEDMKNFYVAISRACHRLVLLTNSTSIHFDK
jgi:DNA helicase-2/ATP-dependent DNA helicase PcrA